MEMFRLVLQLDLEMKIIEDENIDFHWLNFAHLVQICMKCFRHSYKHLRDNITMKVACGVLR